MKSLYNSFLVPIISVFAVTACNGGGTTANQSSVGDNNNSEVKIQNGTVVTDVILNSTVPLLVMKLAGGYSLCSGTFLDPETVLTAAHCVLDMSAKANGKPYTSNNVINTSNITVYLSKDPSKAINLNSVGISNLSNMANAYSIKQIYVHKNAFRGAQVTANGGFNLNTPTDLNDLAILKLATSSNSSFFPQVADQNPSVGTLQTIVGYGANSGTGVQLFDPVYGKSGILRSADSTLSAIRASGMLLNVGGIISSGGQSIYTKICQGDSGGPDFVKINGQFVVTGVHSYGDGINCGGAKTPSTSMSVASYRNWINNDYKTQSISVDNPTPPPAPMPRPTPAPSPDNELKVSLMPCFINGSSCIGTLPLTNVVPIGQTGYIRLNLAPKNSNSVFNQFKVTSLSSYGSDGWSIAVNSRTGQLFDTSCLLSNNLSKTGCSIILQYAPRATKYGNLDIYYSYHSYNGSTVVQKVGKYTFVY